MPKLTVIYEDAGFKAVREVEVNVPASAELLNAAGGFAWDARSEVEAAKDANRVRDNILPGPGGIPA